MSNAVKVIREVADEIMPYTQEHIPDELWTRLWGKLRGAANDVETELATTRAELAEDRARCNKTVRDLYEANMALDKVKRELAAVRAAFAKMEMPDQPERMTIMRTLAAGGVATEVCVAAHKYDTLRTFATAQKVRADEHERDAKRYRWLKEYHPQGNRVPHITQYPYCREIDKVEYPYFTVVGLDAAIDSALKEQGK